MSDLGIIRKVGKTTVVTLNTNYFADDVKPPAPRLYLLRVQLSAAGVLSIRDTVNNWTDELNEGVPLDANKVYVFEIPADPDDTFNFRYSVEATVRKFTLYQAPGT